MLPSAVAIDREWFESLCRRYLDWRPAAGLSTPYQQATALAHVQAKSTVQSANREKSPKLAFEPDKTGSPVDLGRRLPAKMRVFQPERKRIQKTEDWLAERGDLNCRGPSAFGKRDSGRIWLTNRPE